MGYSEPEKIRSTFEDAIFEEYFIRGITFEENKQFATIKNNKTKAELFARDNMGNYIDHDISAMWFAFCIAAEIFTE